jgi:putative hydrolase of the HAD superfamily
MIKVIGTDLDNTLYEQIEFEKGAFMVVAEKIENDFGIDKNMLLKLLIDKFKKNDRDRIFDICLQLLKIERSDWEFYVKTTILPLYRNYKQPILQLSKIGKEIIDFVLKSKLKFCLITNGRVESQTSKLKALNIDNLFDLILISDDYGNKRKPDLLMFIKALEYFKIEGNEMVYIGDDVYTDSVCEKLGIKFINVKDISNISILNEVIYGK